MLRNPKPIEDAAAKKLASIQNVVEAKPYFISLAALLIFTFRDDKTIGEAYTAARQFANRLQADVTGEEE